MGFRDKFKNSTVERIPPALFYMHPPSNKIREGMLDVSDKHSIYYREYGNSKGEPVIFLHGGPGSGCEENDYRFFDPEKYRIILFDQRGSGKSKPLAELKENTPADLIEDIEKLRKHLNVQEKAHVFGGSWGCTLGLLYAIKYPEKVKSLTLRGVYFGDRLQGYYQGDAADLGNPKLIGSGRFFPKEWKEYVNFIPKEERGDMIEAYYRRITRQVPNMTEDDLDTLQNEAAKHWAKWLGAPMMLHPDPEIAKRYDDPDMAKSIGRIGIEYLHHNSYMEDPEKYIMDNLDKLKDIPVSIAQGRYDTICPADNALRLYDKLRKVGNQDVELKLTTAAHSARDPHATETLVDFMDKRVRGKHEMRLKHQRNNEIEIDLSM